MLATDGVYEHAGSPLHRLNNHATTATTSTAPPSIIVEHAYQHGSPDNLTIQIVRIDELPDTAASEVFGRHRTAAASAAGSEG